MFERFREIRLENGLTPEELAKQLDVSVRLVKGVETGKIRLRTKYLIQYATFFNIPTDYLIGMTNQKEIHNESLS